VYQRLAFLEVYDVCHNLGIEAEKLVQVLLTRTIRITNKNFDNVAGKTKGISQP
jgi:antitoxin component of RelBE/YafQ-DinJ toxin-antitoxin module